MAYETLGELQTFIAGADLSTHQYKFVDISAANTVNLPSNGARAVGVVQNNPVSGAAATVCLDGTSKVVCGGTITAGADVATNGSGAAIASTTGLQRLGVALEAGASGRIISVLLVRGANVT